MRIRLLHSYSGTLTNEVRMPEGEHEVTESLGNYLVDNGHAVDVTPVASEPVDVNLDDLQAQGQLTATHNDGSTSTISIADDEPDVTPAPKANKRK